MDALLDSANVSHVFPMHFWDKPEIIQKYMNETNADKLSAIIMDIEQEGQTWSIEI